MKLRSTIFSKEAESQTQDSRIVNRIKDMVLEYLVSENVNINESEEKTRALLREAGAKALGERWTQQAEQEEPEHWECECERKVKGRQKLTKTVVTLLGSTEIKRTYYWCRKCGKGYFWLDERLGCRGRGQTGKVQECIALTVAESFIKWSDTFGDCAGQTKPSKEANWSTRYKPISPISSATNYEWTMRAFGKRIFLSERE